MNNVPDDFRRAASTMEFERALAVEDSVWIIPQDASQDGVKVLDTLGWRGLYGERGSRVYILETADPPPLYGSDEEHTMEPEQLLQARFFAMRTTGHGCAIALSWLGPIVRPRVAPRAEGRLEAQQLRAMLAGVRIGPR